MTTNEAIRELERRGCIIETPVTGDVIIDGTTIPGNRWDEILTLAPEGEEIDYILDEIESKSNPGYTYTEIAEDYNLWREYVDPDGLTFEKQFNLMSEDEKIDIITQCFGPEL